MEKLKKGRRWQQRLFTFLWRFADRWWRIKIQLKTAAAGQRTWTQGECAVINSMPITRRMRNVEQFVLSCQLRGEPQAIIVRRAIYNVCRVPQIAASHPPLHSLADTDNSVGDVTPPPPTTAPKTINHPATHSRTNCWPIFGHQWNASRCGEQLAKGETTTAPRFQCCWVSWVKASGSRFAGEKLCSNHSFLIGALSKLCDWNEKLPHSPKQISYFFQR